MTGKKWTCLLALVLCAAMLLPGCAQSNEKRIEANTRLLEEFLSAPQEAHWYKKVKAQFGAGETPITQTPEDLQAHIAKHQQRRVKVTGMEVLEATPQYLAVTYTLRDFYFDVLGMPDASYNAIFYFKRGAISQITYLQGDEYKDALMAEYSKGSFGIELEGNAIKAVQEGSPAAAAGLLAGDIIVGVDGHSVAQMNTDMNELAYRLRGVELSRCVVRVARGTREFNVLMQRIAGLKY